MYPAPPSVNNSFKQINIDAVKGERSPFKKTTNYHKSSSEINAQAPVTALHSLSGETIVIFQDKASVSWMTCMRSPTSSISLTIFRSLSSSSSSSCSCVVEYEWNLFSKPDISPMALLLCVSPLPQGSLLCCSSTGSRVIPVKSAPVNGRDVTRVDVGATSRGHSWKKDLVNIVLLYNYDLVDIFTCIKH